MNAKTCLIAVSALTILFSNSVVHAKEIVGKEKLVMIGGGECFAKHASNELISAENNWCPVYNDNSDNNNTSAHEKKSKKHKKNNNTSSTTSTTTTIIVIVNNGGGSSGGNNNGGNSGGGSTKECKNKNDAKDGKIGDCDAGKGNNDKNKS